jgi:hypothetical protein
VVALDKLDSTAAAVITAAGGRGVSLFSLPPEHPILVIIAAVRRVTERTTPEHRDQSACLFAHRVLRRLYDGTGEGLAAQVCWQPLLASHHPSACCGRRVLSACHSPPPHSASHRKLSFISVAFLPPPDTSILLH